MIDRSIEILLAGDSPGICSHDPVGPERAAITSLDDCCSAEDFGACPSGTYLPQKGGDL